MMISRVFPPALKHRVKPVLRRWYERPERSRRPCLTILMLHEVHPSGLTPADFEALLQHLGRRNAFARLDEVADTLRAGRELARDTVVMTFDDGLRNNFTYAAPLLIRHRIKATFFVVPGLIEGREWIWTHEALARLRLTPYEQLVNAPGLRPWRTVPHEEQARRAWARTIVDYLKTASERERHALINELRMLAPSLIRGDVADDRFDLMTWNDIRQLDAELFEVGSHSHRHAVLRGLSGQRLDEEVRSSREALERATGRPIVSFCYPNGAFDEAALALVRQHYKQAVTSDDGAIGTEVDFHRLPRLFVNNQVDTLFRLARSRYRFYGSRR